MPLVQSSTSSTTTTTSSTILSTPPTTTLSDSEAVLLLRRERDVLRATVKRLQAEQQTLLAQHAAEREQLQERVLGLEYDLTQQRLAPSPSAADGTLRTQYETLLNKCRAYEQQLADWEVWKSKAESIAQDLALRLKEEQKIRRKLDQYLQEQHGIRSASITGATPPTAARPHSAGPAMSGSGTLTSSTGSNSDNSSNSPAPVPRLPANEFSISVHHL